MKLVFYGLTAFVRQSSGRQIYFSNENPTQNPNVFIPLDCSKTPSEARQANIPWTQVVVDDIGDAKSKKTTVEPWNTGGRRRGGVWIEEAHLALLRKLFSLPVPNLQQYPGSRLHEFQTVLYYAEDANGDRERVGNRYLGYHAKVLNKAKRTVQVWHAGTSGDPNAKKPVQIAKLNFANPEEVDYSTANLGHTEIGVGNGDPQEGALFLTDSYALSVGLEGPKKPPGDGL